jgi:hypothetical protein
MVVGKVLILPMQEKFGICLIKSSNAFDQDRYVDQLPNVN